MKKIVIAGLMTLSAYSVAGPQNGTCRLDHGVFFCTGATELVAANACKVGTGFSPSGCSTEPDGTVGCQCDKRPSKALKKTPFTNKLSK